MFWGPLVARIINQPPCPLGICAGFGDLICISLACVASVFLCVFVLFLLLFFTPSHLPGPQAAPWYSILYHLNKELKKKIKTPRSYKIWECLCWVERDLCGSSFVDVFGGSLCSHSWDGNRERQLPPFLCSILVLIFLKRIKRKASAYEKAPQLMWLPGMYKATTNVVCQPPRNTLSKNTWIQTARSLHISGRLQCRVQWPIMVLEFGLLHSKGSEYWMSTFLLLSSTIQESS